MFNRETAGFGVPSILRNLHIRKIEVSVQLDLTCLFHAGFWGDVGRFFVCYRIEPEARGRIETGCAIAIHGLPWIYPSQYV